jgi:hypothetical protein
VITVGYQRPGKKSVRLAKALNPYPPIGATLDDAQNTPSTVMKSDYVSYVSPKTDADGHLDSKSRSGDLSSSFKETQQSCQNTKYFLRGHHFSLGSEEYEGATSMRDHFAPPPKQAILDFKKEPPKMDTSFGATLENTVTRYCTLSV